MISGKFESTADQIKIDPTSTNRVLGNDLAPNSNHFLESKGRRVCKAIVQQQPVQP